MMLAILVYEFSYVASISEDVDNKFKAEEIAEFNAQIESYANKELTMQEFVTINNLIQDWNERIPAEEIETKIFNTTGNDKVRQYLKKEQYEELLTEVKDKNYICKFSSTDIEYSKTRKNM